MLKEKIREFKILLINSELSINEERFNEFKTTQSYKDYITNEPNGIITGSWSLYLFNLINRKPGDFDIVIDEVPNNVKKHSDGAYLIIHGLNSLGYVIKGKTKFDYFKNSEIEYIEIDGVKISYPLETIIAKLKIVDEYKVEFSDKIKHEKDLNDIKNILEKEVKNV